MGSVALQFAVGAGGALTADSPASVPAGSTPISAIAVTPPPLTTWASPSVAVGGQIIDTRKPLRRVEPDRHDLLLNLYGPGNSTCSSLSTSTQTFAVSGNGSRVVGRRRRRPRSGHTAGS